MTEVLPKWLLIVIFVFVTGYPSVLPAEISNLNTKYDAFEYNEDAYLEPRQLIEKYGYRGETHKVITADGYILEMHRITGRKRSEQPISGESNGSTKGKQPVLVVHGLLSSSVDWIITGPERAFGYILADEGYDVWLGNVRGNTFSRKHKKYTTLDKEYWQFSWHEIAISDLPVMIDYVLEKTDRQQLIYVGHSQGTTGFWVMASERPEYQKKIKAMFAFAPVAYATHVKSPFYHYIAKFGNNIEKIMSLLGVYQFEPTSELLKDIAGLVCDDESWSQTFCTNIIFLIAGFGSDQLNKTMLPAILGHTPAGSSVRQIVHYGQVLNAQKFQQYDYGIVGNLKKYKKLRPPTYDLSKISVPVYLHYSLNDWLCDPKDVNRLHEELGNSMGMFKVPHEKFGHLDFVWGQDAKALFIDKVIALMEIYRS